MRQKLQHLGNVERHTFRAFYDGVGYKAYRDKYSPTIVFRDVTYNGESITDHLWFNYTKRFGQLGMLKHEDEIQFDGRVSIYHKGYYLNRQTDYKISYPSKVKLLTHSDWRPSLPLVSDDKNALIGYVMERNKAFYLRTGQPYDDWYVKQYHQWCDQRDQTK